MAAIQNKRTITIGIQGGQGSFNEQAARTLLEANFFNTKHSTYPSKLKYLHTTQKVLHELTQAKIDYGLFAVRNSLGGEVEETAEAITKFRNKFQVEKEFSMKIQHYLMKHKDIETNAIKLVMAHPQVLKQCAKNLQAKYPQLSTISGERDLIDTATVASSLASGNLAKATAILGPKALAKIYNLKIIDSNLQDDQENFTTFWLVSR